uniref:TrbG/VirB9 family P-type conjugative transfer protein n=1 Tax=Pseudomonas syringae TaxID=317 RepID=UPI001E470969|nr:TrbG/VirB9 family P-type conjugative transfer protein [Pseudomonas syringae]QOQ33611.1 hypothetical protein [Pseudomonas syringae pv. actinidiae]
MKKAIINTGVSVILLATAVSAQAASCRVIHWKPDMVIEVNSAMYLGTRIEFPADIIMDPVPSSTLWDTDGATSQIVVKPNSQQPDGSQAVVRAWTADGNSYDILAKRVSAAQNDTCVKVVADGMVFTPEGRAALQAQSARLAQGNAAAGVQAQQLQQQLSQVRRQAEDDKKKAVVEALRRFRYHVYTRYSWDEGSGFAAKGIITDVYDDGRFTYIRLNQPNRGLLSVETEIGGKNAVVHTSYDDAYGMYVISGIYPKFTLRADEAEIGVKRANSDTHGEF